MPRLATETFGTGDQSWLGSTHGISNARSVILDRALFTAADYPNGYLPSGLPLGRVTATGRFGPYTGDATDEVQTVTVTGSPTGGTFTLTFGGQTTTAIAYNAAASAVQAALQALSTIGAGNVVVTGSAGGPFTVTFQGALANTNVAQLTSTPSLTGGSSPSVAHATSTAGGADASSDGREILAGFLLTDQRVVSATENINAPMIDHGRIRVDRLPVVFLTTGHNTAGTFVFVTSGGA